MPEPTPPEVRAAILTDIKARKYSQRKIATKHNVSTSTVRKIAHDNGIADPFSREKTKNATAARAIDNKARRAELAALLIEDTFRLQKRAWEEHHVVANGPEGPETLTLPLPPPREVQALYTSIGIATQRHMELENFDRDTGDTGAKSMLSALMQGLGHAYDKLNPPPPAEPDAQP